MALFGGGGFKQVPTLSPQQMGAQSQLLQQAMSMLQNLPKSNFAPIAQQARTRFQEQTIPGLAEQFTALPGQGGQRSSAFQGALGRAGAGLEENLAAMESQFGLQQRGLDQQLINALLGIGFQPQFALQPKGSGLGDLLGQLAGGALQYGLPLLGGAFGGPAGGVAGSAFSNLLRGGFA